MPGCSRSAASSDPQRVIRRTSKRRTSRRVRPNVKSFVEEVSPLDYSEVGLPAGMVRRISLIDTEAPAPAHSYYTFQRTERTRKYGRGGRELKRPVVEVTPGATENTVAYIDFVPWSDGGLRISFMAVRDDLRGHKLGRDLLYHFIDKAEREGAPWVHFGKIMSPRVWKMYEDLRALSESGALKLKISGSNYT